MPVTKDSLRKVVEETIEGRPFKEFRRQFSLLDVVLSLGNNKIKHPCLHLRGSLSLNPGEKTPVVQGKEQGKILCGALREALKGKLGNNVVAAMLPVEGKGVGCHWEGVIPLGPAVGPIMARVGSSGCCIIRRTVSRCNVPTGPTPTYTAPWKRGLVRT